MERAVFQIARWILRGNFLYSQLPLCVIWGRFVR